MTSLHSSEIRCYKCKQIAQVSNFTKLEHCQNPLCREILVVGDYNIAGLLGKGGCGAVFEAEHKFLSKRTAAIKLLKKQQFSDPDMATRFLREANIMMDLEHHNIVKLYDFSVLADGSYFLVMEKLVGESLQERMLSSPSFPITRLKWLFEQICDGLSYIHENEIVHCDLKPGNIFLSGERGNPKEIKLIDFGISYLQMNSHLSTSTKGPIGTPAYMSPEQITGNRDQLDKRSDLFAIGVILYQLLTGRIPYPSKEYGSLVFNIVNVLPTELSNSVPQKLWAPELEKFIQRSMAKKVEDRPQTALQFWKECELALSAQEHLEPEVTYVTKPFPFQSYHKDTIEAARNLGGLPLFMNPNKENFVDIAPTQVLPPPKMANFSFSQPVTQSIFETDISQAPYVANSGNAVQKIASKKARFTFALLLFIGLGFSILWLGFFSAPSISNQPKSTQKSQPQLKAKLSSSLIIIPKKLSRKIKNLKQEKKVIRKTKKKSFKKKNKRLKRKTFTFAKNSTKQVPRKIHKPRKLKRKRKSLKRRTNSTLRFSSRKKAKKLKKSRKSPSKSVYKTSDENIFNVE